MFSKLRTLGFCFYKHCVYLQFMSTCTVASSGCVLLLFVAWHFSWECRSWRPRFLTMISLRTRWPPALVLRKVEILLASWSFRYQVTTGRGLPAKQETKKLIRYLRSSQGYCRGFRSSGMWHVVRRVVSSSPLTERHNVHSRNLNVIIALLSRAVTAVIRTTENVGEAPLSSNRLISRLLNSTVFYKRMTTFSDDHEVKRGNQKTENGCWLVLLRYYLGKQGEAEKTEGFLK